MSFSKCLLILPFVFICFKSWGLVIEDKRGRGDVVLPDHWSYERDLLGLPHVFLSPGGKEKVSVSLTLTGIEDVKLPGPDLKKNQKEYWRGREDWAKKRGIKILKFHPYMERLNQKKVRVHQIGVEYRGEGSELLEMSYYLECQKSFVHMKSVGPKVSLHQGEAVKIIDSYSCL